MDDDPNEIYPCFIFTDFFDATYDPLRFTSFYDLLFDYPLVCAVHLFLYTMLSSSCCTINFDVVLA